MGSRRTNRDKPDLIQDYLNHLRRRNCVARTIHVRTTILRVFDRWLTESGVDLTDVTPEDLDRFIIHLCEERTYSGSRPMKPNSRSNYIKALRGLYDFLHSENLLLSNPAESLRYPKKRKRIHRDVLTPKELIRLLTAPDVSTPEGLRDAAALHVLACSGLRAFELVALDLKHVDLKSREIEVRGGKGGRDRIAFFDVTTRQVFARYLVQARPVLVSGKTKALLIGDKGRRISQRQIGVIVSRYAKKARLRKHLTPHSLRRTLATLLLQAGVNLKALAEIMGHDRISSTAQYTKLDIKTLIDVYRQAHPLSGE